MNDDLFNPNGCLCPPITPAFSVYEQNLRWAMMAQQITQATAKIDTLRNALGSKAAEPEPPDDGNLHIRIKRKKIEFNFNN
jgi:hypothetical protein